MGSQWLNGTYGILGYKPVSGDHVFLHTCLIQKRKLGFISSKFVLTYDYRANWIEYKIIGSIILIIAHTVMCMGASSPKFCEIAIAIQFLQLRKQDLERVKICPMLPMSNSCFLQ